MKSITIGVLFMVVLLLVLDRLDPMGSVAPPAPTDLSNPTAVRNDLRETVFALLTDICRGGGTVNQVCIEGTTVTGENVGQCLPIDCDLTYGIQGDRQ